MQYEKQGQVRVFTNALKGIVSDVQDVNEFVILKAAYMLMELGKTEAFEHLAEYGITVNEITPETLKMVRSRVLQLDTQIRINQLNSEAEQQEQPEQNADRYIQSVIDFQNILKIQIDPYRITLSEWLGYNNKCTAFLEAQKKQD
jgi:hypothetical protein